MSKLTTDRRTFMSGVAATSMFGLGGVGADGRAVSGPMQIRDDELFEQGSSTIQLTIEGIDPPMTRLGPAIECYAWEWDMTVPEDFSGPTEIGALNVLKGIDQTTPLLMTSFESGTVHPSAELSMAVGTATGREVETLRLSMEDVRIVSLVTEGRVDFGTFPESLTVVFQEIEVTHPETGYTFLWNRLNP